MGCCRGLMQVTDVPETLLGDCKWRPWRPCTPTIKIYSDCTYSLHSLIYSITGTLLANHSDFKGVRRPLRFRLCVYGKLPHTILTAASTKSMFSHYIAL